MIRKKLLICIYAIAAFTEVYAQCSNNKPCRGIQGGDRLIEPPVLQSQNGKLNLTLSVEMATFTFDWFTTQRRSFNGSIPGPTWLIRPGDVVTVTIINNLETTVNEETKPNNTMRFPNLTNIHTHGLHISSKEPQDDVFISIGPGENYTYIYKIEEDHPAGTYWYHTHLHGSTTLQIFSGLAGILIVEDPTSGPAAMPQHLADISCPDNCQHDIPLIIQPVLQYADISTFNRGFAQIQTRTGDDPIFRPLNIIDGNITLAEWLTNVSNGFDYQTTNGQIFPFIKVETGQRKRFRLINGGGTKGFELLITDEGGLTQTNSCDIFEIAIDGMYLNSARRPRLGKSFLASAARVDWIVVCNKPGVYELRSVSNVNERCSLGFTERYNNVILTINVSGSIVSPTNQETNLPQRPFYVGDFLETPESEIFSERFTVEASFLSFLNRKKFSTKNDFRFKIPVGKVQEWHLTNTDFDDGHPLHIHINHFQVISYNPYTGPISSYTTGRKFTLVYHDFGGDLCDYQVPSHSGAVGIQPNATIVNGSNNCPIGQYVDHSKFSNQLGPNSAGYVTPGEFRDVFMVPPLGNVTIRFMAHKFLGTLIVHCHTVSHADSGMLMVVEIAEERDVIGLNQSAAFEEIGQCFTDSSSGSQLQCFHTVLAVIVGVVCSVFLL